MSAYIVSNNHINLIASYFADHRHGEGLWCELDGSYGYLSPLDGTAEKLAHILFDENVRSVNARYTEAQSPEFNYVYLSQARRYYSPEEIARALDCLEYQLCETDDYRQSKAWELMCAMRKDLLDGLAMKAGVDSWSIDELKWNKSKITFRED
jgi:hypothetical protein